MSRPRTALDVEGRAAAGRPRVRRSRSRPMPPGRRRRTGATRGDILQEQARDRVSELTPIRYGRMLLSPFTFNRGAAAVTAAGRGLAKIRTRDTSVSGIHGRVVARTERADQTLPASRPRRLRALLDVASGTRVPALPSPNAGMLP